MPMPLKQPGRLTMVSPDERTAVAWSAACFFCLLCSWYTIRPVREAMGLTGGIRDLQWLFYATMGVMLIVNPIFAAIVSRFRRRRVVLGVYVFFSLNLLAFVLLFRALAGDDIVIARIFYVWASVFNLIVLSLFWSVMADLFTREQATRLFGIIGAGGPLGGIAGAATVGLLAERLGDAERAEGVFSSPPFVSSEANGTGDRSMPITRQPG